MTSLKMAAHTSSGRQMVEVFDANGVFVAAIYPHEAGIHIVSKYFGNDPIQPSPGMVPIPGYTVQFKEKS